MKTLIFALFFPTFCTAIFQAFCAYSTCKMSVLSICVVGVIVGSDCYMCHSASLSKPSIAISRGLTKAPRVHETVRFLTITWWAHNQNAVAGALRYFGCCSGPARRGIRNELRLVAAKTS